MQVSNFEISGTFCYLTSLCSYLKMNILKVFQRLVCLFQRGVESIQVTEYLMAADELVSLFCALRARGFLLLLVDMLYDGTIGIDTLKRILVFKVAYSFIHSSIRICIVYYLESEVNFA